MSQIQTDVINALLEAPRTRSEVSAAIERPVPLYVTRALAETGVIKIRETVRSGKRGRPAHRFALTDKGRKRARRAQKVG